MKLTKDTIKHLSNRKTKEVSIAGYEIRIIEMTIPQQLEVERMLKDKTESGQLLSPVLKFSVVDDNNEPLLNDDIINSMPASLAAELFRQCVEFNSISEKDLEKRAKNS